MAYGLKTSSCNPLRALISRPAYKDTRGRYMLKECFEIEGHQGKVKGHGGTLLNGFPQIWILVQGSSQCEKQKLIRACNPSSSPPIKIHPHVFGTIIQFVSIYPAHPPFSPFKSGEKLLSQSKSNDRLKTFILVIVATSL